MMIGATHPSIACAFRDVKAHPGGDGQDVTELYADGIWLKLFVANAIRFVPSHYHTQVVAEDPLAHGFIVQSHGDKQITNRDWRAPGGDAWPER